MGISGYDVITANTLDATLESFDEDAGPGPAPGADRGLAAGGPGLDDLRRRPDASIAGWAGSIGVELNRNESRRPGPIEAGLDVKSTLTMTRAGRPAAGHADRRRPARYSLEINARSERLVQNGPDGKSSFLHDRHWHVFWGDPKLMVLKRLDGGRVVAQCNLVVGPPAGRGRHQDPAQFRDEIRRVLDQRFVQFIGTGEVDGDPAGGFRFKVGVQGREGDLGVVWYYYLVASPAGDQLVVTYTLAAQDAQAFGDQDVADDRHAAVAPAPAGRRAGD